jgi:RND family efflux transporter MFP subunit
MSLFSRMFVLFALATASSSSVAACKNSGAAAGEQEATPKLPVEVLTLQEEPLRDGAEYLAQLVSRHQVTIFPQVVGTVSAIMVKPGDVVKQGAALLQIDPRREAANLAQLQALRSQRVAAVTLAKSIEQRSKKLLAEGLLSPAQYEQDKSMLEAAEQDLKAQDAALQAQGVALTYYRIIAPFDGVVGDIPVKLGDMVSAQTKLTSVADNTSLELYVNVPIEKLSLFGDESRIEVLDGTGALVGEAPVSFISAETNPQVQSVLIKGVMKNLTSLRAGQIVRSRVVFKTHPGVRVPLPAVMRQSGQYFVFVAEDTPAGTIVHQRAVELGELADNRYAVIKGLARGDRIAISQLQKLRDAAPIEALAPAPSPSSSSSAAPAPAPSTSASAP